MYVDNNIQEKQTKTKQNQALNYLWKSAAGYIPQ